MSSSSSDEEDPRLAEAVDSSILDSSLYDTKKKKEDENSSKEISLKSSLTINGENSFKRNRPQTEINKKSLRRDRNLPENQVMSDLDVTPQFQAHVATHLDKLLAEQIKEVDRIKKPDEITSSPGSGTEPASCQAAGDNTVRLLRRCAVAVDVTPKVFIQTRPDLLAHRKVQVDESSAEFREMAVTPQSVLNKEGTEHYANRFANRVEPGIERIKKKKKKKDKKKKKTGEKENGTEEPVKT